jgi:hypothetical protein
MEGRSSALNFFRWLTTPRFEWGWKVVGKRKNPRACGGFDLLVGYLLSTKKGGVEPGQRARNHNKNKENPNKIHVDLRFALSWDMRDRIR